MKSIIPFAFFVFLFQPLFSQEIKSLDLQLGAHYWAVDLVDPGLMVSADLPLLGKQSGEGLRYLVANFDIGYYYKYRSHNGINFTPGLSFRMIRIPTGRMIDLKLGLGFQRSKFDGEVLEVIDETNFIVSDDTGQNLFMPYFMFRFGKDWRFTRKKPIGWNIGVGTYGRMFVNRRVVPGLFFTGGISYFFSTKPKFYED